MNRFDYVQYDETATSQQVVFKQAFMNIEMLAQDALINGRAKSLVLTKLEEAYMWVGKAIRDDQVGRGSAAPLQEQRSGS